MQLTRFAVLVKTIIVVDAVGDIRGLLDFHQIASVEDGVYASGGNEETVAIADSVFSQCVADGLVFNHLFVFFGCNLFFETIIETGTRFRVQDIPHLRLTTGLSLAAGSLVRGMYLDAQVSVGIDELDEQRKLIAKALEISLAKESRLFFMHQVVDGFCGDTITLYRTKCLTAGNS